MTQVRAKVYVVDDDASVRRSLCRLLSSAGYDVESHAGSESYLALGAPSTPACLVVDMRMPGMGGLELQRAIAGTARELPVVFITGHADEATRMVAMATGAVDVIPKPFDGQVLLEAIARALAPRVRASA